jgi:hypothetical protein
VAIFIASTFFLVIYARNAFHVFRIVADVPLGVIMRSKRAAEGQKFAIFTPVVYFAITTRMD